MSPLTLTLLTDQPPLAGLADRCGVTRIGPDLEAWGKPQRQDGTGSRISAHRLDALPEIAAVLGSAQLFVRLNPYGAPDFAAELEYCLDQGAQVLMLPMFETLAEAEGFAAAVAGRATTVLLIETPPALALAKTLSELPGIDELHLGLNDLRLALGLGHHFELLLDERLEQACRVIHASGKPLGIAGLGRYGDDQLPIPARLVYAGLTRLGATGALLSRSFFSGLAGEQALRQELALLHQGLAHWRAADTAMLAQASAELRERLAALKRKNPA